MIKTVEKLEFSSSIFNTRTHSMWSKNNHLHEISIKSLDETYLRGQSLLFEEIPISRKKKAAHARSTPWPLGVFRLKTSKSHTSSWCKYIKYHFDVLLQGFGARKSSRLSRPFCVPRDNGRSCSRSASSWPLENFEKLLPFRAVGSRELVASPAIPVGRPLHSPPPTRTVIGQSVSRARVKPV